jgi:hypothetical protein
MEPYNRSVTLLAMALADAPRTQPVAAQQTTDFNQAHLVRRLLPTVVNIVNHDKGAKILLAGIETMHMIRKRQLDSTKGQFASAAIQFYSLAF